MGSKLGLAFVTLFALSALAAVGLMAFSRHHARIAPQSPGVAPGGATPRPTLSPTAGPAPAVAPATKTVVASTSPPPPAETLGAFRGRMQGAARARDKAGYRTLLQRWRTGALDQARERVLDDLLAEAQRADPPSAELDKAAGRLFLETTHADQRAALGSILAGSGSDAALGYLIHGVAEADARAAALKALGTVSAPGALPQLARAVEQRPDDAELRAAVRAALRNVDTPKARDLERRLDAR